MKIKSEGNKFYFSSICHLIDLDYALLPAVVKEILLEGSGPNKYLLFWVLKISKKRTSKIKKKIEVSLRLSDQYPDT